MDCYECNGESILGDYPYSIKPYSCYCSPTYMVTEDWPTDTKTVIIKVKGQEIGYTFTNEMLMSLGQTDAWLLFRKAFKEAIYYDKRVLDLLREIVENNFHPYSYTSKYNSGGYIYGGNSYDTLNSNYYTSKKDPWYDVGYTYKDIKFAPQGAGKRPEVDKLPGLKAMVKYPGKYRGYAEEPLTMVLEHAIIRLNDKDKWTREQIADWLETLDVDITFRSADANEV